MNSNNKITLSILTKILSDELKENKHIFFSFCLLTIVHFMSFKYFLNNTIVNDGMILLKSLLEISLGIFMIISCTKKIIVDGKQIYKKIKFNYPNNEIAFVLWSLCLNEDFQAYLIDYQNIWYEGKNLNWKTHFLVQCKSFWFVVKVAGCDRFVQTIKNKFNPLHKPRLPIE